MNLSANSIVKLALLVIGGVLLQITALSQLTFFGASADLSPLIVASVGLLAGAELGAVMGFSIGLMVDLTLLQTLGVSSLLYTAVGYFAGRYGEIHDPTDPMSPLVAGAGATLAATVGYSIVQMMLGVHAPVSALLVREIMITVLLNTLLAIPVFLAIRRLLRSNLKEEVLPRSSKHTAAGRILTGRG